jgi:transcriptional regulator with XRE-family HTH domain
MNPQTIQRGGKTYVLVEQGEYERLTGNRTALPPLPDGDAEGNVDAVEFARATIARNIISRREAVGMTQATLARTAGIRVETLNRIENARHTADVATLAKIDAALGAATGPSAKMRPSKGALRSDPVKGSGRALINAGTDERYVRRGSSGSFLERDDVGRSLYGSKSGRGTRNRTNRKK